MEHAPLTTSYDLPLADSAALADAPLVSQLKASQQHMIRLNNAIPRPSNVLRQHLDYWFRRTFPALAGTMTVHELSVRTLREETIPAAQRTAYGPATRRTVTDILFLETLLLQAVAGRIDPHAVLRDMDNIEIVTCRDSTTTAPAALNEHAVKTEIQRLISTTPALYERLLIRALDECWNKPADFSQARNVSDWLADELARQLKAQADLHRLDTTLSPQMHKALTDYALSAPDAASRAGMAERVRPGVYSLSFTPRGWGFAVPISATVALTRHDNTNDPGGAVLYCPGRPLEVYDDLAALKANLQQEGNAEDEVSTTPITESFLTRLVADLRTTQKTAISRVVSNGPAAGEELAAWVNRLDAAADIGARLDLANAMDERELRLNLKKLNEWLHGNPHVTGGDRLAWWRATQALHDSLLDTPPPPDPVTLATPDALRERTRKLLAGFIKEKYPPVDPEDVSLSIRKELIDPYAPTGTSPYGSGVSMGTTRQVFDDQRSMTQWAMANLTEDERQAAQPVVVGPLTFAQIVEVIERADVGARLPSELQRVGRERQAQWMSLKGRQMRAQAWAAHINGDLRHERDDIGLKLVLTALDSPTPTGRGKINGHEVVVHQLQWGDSVLKEILAFGVKTPASRPSLTLYTPGAPDRKIFRDVDAQSARALEKTLAQTLTATPQMTRWLIAQLPLLEQTAQLDSMMPAEENLTFEQRIKKITQSTFAWMKDRAQNDFTLNIASPLVTGNLLEALHETQITHAVKTARMLTVSNAERDSATAREGRRNGVALLTGALSMFPAGRLGGILGHSILPVMAAGAAVSAIADEGGSFSQWASDFISGLREVVAEGGQDLIMARAGRRRGKTRPALSPLPRMPAPELEPFALRGLDAKGLVPEGRNRYRGADGQGYLKLGEHYYKTAMQGGERIIYAPNNRTNQRIVTWEHGRWQLQERQRLLGGGSVLTLFKRTPETPERRTYNVLMEAVLVDIPSPSHEVANRIREAIDSLPGELAERILNESMAALNTADVSTYRSRISDLSHGRESFTAHQPRHADLMHKINIWNVVNDQINIVEKNMTGVRFTVIQKIKIYDKAMSIRRELTDSGTGVTFAMGTWPDNFTGALYIVITPAKGRKKDIAKKLYDDNSQMLIAAEKKVQAVLQARYPDDENLVQYSTVPENRREYKKQVLEVLREDMKARNKPGLLTEIRNKKIPYVIVNKGKAQQRINLTTEEDISHFNRNLSNYSAFEIEAVTRVPAKKVTDTPATTPPTVLPAAPAPAEKKFTVNTSPLAETQMSYDSFPANAGIKIMDIMEDIGFGRTTTKRINQYYWYDMAQLSPGGGRGAWRAAFERQGDTWTLQGFYDYHGHKPATVWEG